MLKSLYNGVTGLKSYQTGLDVVATNISNVNTTAYKSKSVGFSSLLSQTLSEANAASNVSSSTNPRQVGLGVKIASTKTNITTPGAVETTGYAWDMRINGDTFFVVHDGQENYYTKDGTFEIDVNGDLVTRTSGYYVYGWPSTDGVSIDKTQELQKLHVLDESHKEFPDPTTYLRILGNIDGSDGELSTTGDPVSVSIYDSNGETYTLTFAFTKDSSDSGNTLLLNLQGITDSQGNAITLPDDNPAIRLTYNDDGALQNANGAANGQITLNLPTEIAGPGSLTLDVSETTMMNRPKRPVTFSDGLPDWVKLDTASDTNGYMSTTYKTTDGVTHSAATVDFSDFSAENKDSLLNSGFYFTCCTCDNYYSIQFVSGTDNTVVQDGSYYIYQIGIDDISNGKDLVNEIISATGGNPNSHFTELAGNDATLTLYDQREYPAFAGNEFSGLVGRGVANYNKESTSISSSTALRGDADGSGAGSKSTLTGYTTDDSGTIYAVYSSGGKRMIGQIAAAKFPNQTGLASEGQNLYAATANSGVPEFLDVTDDGGAIYAGELEMSNVNLSDEFTQMIIMQRAFQSNSRVISTSDNMLETIKNLKA